MNNRIYALDIFRALAISLVVLTHFVPHWFPLGSVGVSIFFSLSGYLVTKQLLNAEVRVEQFLLRRFFKIYPPYLFAVFLQLLLMYVFGSGLREKYIHSLPGLLLVMNMPKEWMGLGVGVFWSLHVEMCFYVVMAAVVSIFGRGKYFFLSLLLLCVGTMFGKVMAMIGVANSGNSLSRLFIWGDGLFYGGIVAALSNAKRPIIDFGHLYFVLICLVVIVAVFLPNEDSLWLPISSIVSFVTALAILGVAKYGAIVRIPDIRLVRYVAQISYSLYLFHGSYWTFIQCLGRPLYAILAGLTTSVLVYYAVEVNSLKVERYIERKLSFRR